MELFVFPMPLSDAAAIVVVYSVSGIVASLLLWRFRTPYVQSRKLQAENRAQQKKDEYGAVSMQYARFRPKYPLELLQDLGQYYDKYCKLPRTQASAADIGAGTGIFAEQLVSILGFSRVYGVDKSAGQLEAAVANPKLIMQVGTAENTGLEDGSVSLVTAATALHWFDIDAFLRESSRILRADGILAVASYTRGSIKTPECAREPFEQCFQSFMNSKYWSPENKYWHIDTAFESVDFQSNFQNVERRWYQSEVRMNISDVVALVRTSSTSENWRREGAPNHPADILQQTLLSMPDIQNNGGLACPVMLDFPYFLVVGRKK